MGCGGYGDHRLEWGRLWLYMICCRRLRRPHRLEREELPLYICGRHLPLHTEWNRRGQIFLEATALVKGRCRWRGGAFHVCASLIEGHPVVQQLLQRQTKSRQGALRKCWEAQARWSGLGSG